MCDSSLFGRSRMPHRINQYALVIFCNVVIGLSLQAYAAEPPPLLRAQSSEVALDPARPLKIGEDFYPVASRRLGETGRCVVRIVVDKSGDVHDPQIVTSSGFERLDAACIAAFSSGHMIPATENGFPIEKTVAIPINWSLNEIHTTSRQPMFAGFPVLDTIVVTAQIKPELEATNPAVSFSTSTCYLLVWIRSSGKIQAVQVVKSSGYPRLDDACRKAVINQKMLPWTRDGAAIDAWVIIPVEWRLRLTAKAPPQVPTADEPIAILAPNQSLGIDHVPDGVMPEKDTVCAAHILISETGSAEQITVTQSTGSPDLDKLCTDAMRPIKFIPAWRDGHSVAGTSDVWIGWSTTDSGAAPTIASTPSTSVPREKVQLSPQLIQTLHLKGLSLGMQKAAGSAERASCLLSLWYTGDGTIQGAQLVKASGFPKIDQACLQVVMGQKVEPLTSEREFGGWSRLPINWIFGNAEDAAQPLRIEPDPSIPALTSSGSMRPLLNYPSAALAQRVQGICKMHVAVSAAGAVSALEITQSTGSPALDLACKKAIYESPFVPATNGDQMVSGTTEVAIVWRLSPLNVSR